MLQAIIGSFFGVGSYFVFADLFRIPNIKTSRAVSNLNKRQKKKTSVVDIWLISLARRIAGHLRLNEYRRLQLEADLRTAGIDTSPELYMAQAMVKAGIYAAFASPAFFLLPFLMPVVIALVITVYTKELHRAEEQIKNKRQSIDSELPRLVFTIEKTLIHSRDVLSLLDGYRSNAGKDLKAELDVTVADMRSGNYESALTRLEARVGSVMLSDLVRGLISILRGDDTQQYWQALSIKFADIQRQALRLQAVKVPGKVRKLSMLLLLCFMLTYIVVLITQIVTSLGVILT